MYSEGHWGIGMLLYAPIVFILLLFSPALLPHLLLGVAVVAFTCSLPDIDMKLKNFTPIKHRGITHTVWFALFVGLIVAGISFAAGYYAAGSFSDLIVMEDVYFFTMFGGAIAVYGTLSHFVGDVITPTGLRPLKPFSDRHFRYVMTVAGQKSKAANGYWNKALHLTGTTAVVLAFILGTPAARRSLARFIRALTRLL